MFTGGDSAVYIRWYLPRLPKLPISVAMVPDNELLVNTRARKLARVHIPAGIIPVKSFWNPSKISRPVMLPIVSGIGPISRFSSTTTCSVMFKYNGKRECRVLEKEAKRGEGDHE